MPPSHSLPEVDQRVDVWFEGYDEFYGGRVTSVTAPFRFRVILDDESDWDIDTRRHIYRLSTDLPAASPSASPSAPSSAPAYASAGEIADASPLASPPRTRRSSASPSTPSTPTTPNTPSRAERAAARARRSTLSPTSGGGVASPNDDGMDAVPLSSDKPVASSSPSPLPSTTTEDPVQQPELPDPAFITNTPPSSDRSRRRTSGRALRKNTSAPRAPRRTDRTDLSVDITPAAGTSVAAVDSPSPRPIDVDVDVDLQPPAPSVLPNATASPRRSRPEPAKTTTPSAQRKRAADPSVVDGEPAADPKKRRIDPDDLKLPKKNRHTVRFSDVVLEKHMPLPSSSSTPSSSLRDKHMTPPLVVPPRPIAPPRRPTPTKPHSNGLPVSPPHTVPDPSDKLSAQAITAIAVDAALESAKSVLDPINDRLSKILAELEVVSKDLVVQKRALDDELALSEPKPPSVPESDTPTSALVPAAGTTVPSAAPTATSPGPITRSKGDMRVVSKVVSMASLETFQVDVSEIIGGGEARLRAYASLSRQEFDALHRMVEDQGKALREMDRLLFAAKAFSEKAASKPIAHAASTKTAVTDGGKTRDSAK